MKTDRKESKQNLRVSASMALEMAVVLPLILILIFVFYGHVREIEQSMSCRHALDQVATEIELLYPLSDLVSAGQEIEDLKLLQIIDELGLRDYIMSFATDIVGSLLAGPALNYRYNHWLQKICAAREQEMPKGERRFFVDYVPQNNLIYLGMSYSRTSLLSSGEEYITTSIPLWSRGKYKISSNTGDDEESDDIWSMSNFQRGLEFRRLYGANLPATYPCIAIWNAGSGTAGSIKSMDLTAPSWQTKSAAETRVYSFIANLASFEGGAEPGPQIGEIKKRQLILVIPRNHAAWLDKDVMDQWSNYANVRGVELKISSYGESHRYQQDG
ncbi:MAG: hypothetical protein PHR78_05370 [Eubacteriales bacterium]|nr:hypothetical protein [Eubacteriales bacterium]MDD4541567.1 hypothetical protein [Eubacteriales bacterium]